MPNPDDAIKFALLRSKMLLVRRAVIGMQAMALDREAWDEVEALAVEVESIIHRVGHVLRASTH